MGKWGDESKGCNHLSRGKGAGDMLKALGSQSSNGQYEKVCKCI